MNECCAPVTALCPVAGKRGTMNKEFFDRIQQHERSWGSEKYAGRPELSDIMATPVVGFWALAPKKGAADQRYIITTHKDLKDIEQWYLHAVVRLHIQLPDRRLVAIYKDQKKVTVKGVSITFDIREGE